MTLSTSMKSCIDQQRVVYTDILDTGSTVLSNLCQKSADVKDHMFIRTIFSSHKGSFIDMVHGPL